MNILYVVHRLFVLPSFLANRSQGADAGAGDVDEVGHGTQNYAGLRYGDSYRVCMNSRALFTCSIRFWKRCLARNSKECILWKLVISHKLIYETTCTAQVSSIDPEFSK